MRARISSFNLFFQASPSRGPASTVHNGMAPTFVRVLLSTFEGVVVAVVVVVVVVVASVVMEAMVVGRLVVAVVWRWVYTLVLEVWR